MTLPNQPAVLAALLISAIAILAWLLLAIKVFWALARKQEQRRYILAMPVVGLLAALGTLASAIGFGMARGIIHIELSADVLTLVASMGRGGLLMGGVIALAYYRPSAPN